MNAAMTNFDDIRPYRDHEVKPVLERLMSDQRLITTVANHKFPVLTRLMPRLVPWLIQQRLKRELKPIHDVNSFQMLIADAMARTIKRTTSGFSFNGIDNLDPKQQYLFISNHRDIAMDPAFLNYALHLNGHDTFEIAIGDNLLTHPLATELMRLNRSFIVKRSVEGLRNKLAAMAQLSEYIHQTLEQGTSAWIAQREGRAKDGIDATDPALIKMLYIYGKRQKIDFSDYIAGLKIVPVAISYEYDPCDFIKARELEARSQHKPYAKADNEDLNSIIRGISQPKGRVHVGIGEPLTGQFDTAEQVAQAIDAQIADQYRLYESNIAALEWLALNWRALASLPELTRERLTEIQRQARHTWSRIEPQQLRRKTLEFSERLAGYPQHLRQYVVEMYANPAITKYTKALTST